MMVQGAQWAKARAGAVCTALFLTTGCIAAELGGAALGVSGMTTNKDWEASDRFVLPRALDYRSFVAASIEVGRAQGWSVHQQDNEHGVVILSKGAGLGAFAAAMVVPKTHTGGLSVELENDHRTVTMELKFSGNFGSGDADKVNAMMHRYSDALKARLR